MSKWILAALSLSLAAPAAAQPGGPMFSGANPAQAVETLRAWGYSIGGVELGGEVPLVQIDDEHFITNIGFGGCTSGRDCRYIVLTSFFTDAPGAPYEWLNQINADHDFVSAVRDPDGLRLQAGVILGTAGIPRSTFEHMFDAWRGGVGQVAQAAIAAGLVQD